MRAKNKITPALLVAAAALFALVGAQAFTFILNTDSPEPSGTGLPLKWPSGKIPMKIMVDNTTTLIDGLTRAKSIQAAMTQWNQKLGAVQFTNTIETVGDGHDGPVAGVSSNEIFFTSSPYDGQWDTNTLAITTGWSVGNTRTETDILFNNAYTWDSYRGASRVTSAAGPYDIQRVALHELGHALGLDHPDEATPEQNVTAIMNSRTSSLDSLANDDISGGQSLYGPPGVPANDNFANATTLTIPNGSTPTTVTGYNTNATKETGEFNHATNRGGHSIWWKFTSPATGLIKVDTRGSYSDTLLAVYTGTAVNALTFVTANDDIKDGVEQNSSVTFPAGMGITYYVAVDGYNGDDGDGADSSAITLNVGFTATDDLAPIITLQPAAVTVASGGTATFTVAATGATSYQWLRNGNPVNGATSASLTLTNVTSANAGGYVVTVTNTNGSVTSEIAILTVTSTTPPPPPPPSNGGGGGGGGGAPSPWFLAALAALAFTRWRLKLGAKA